MIASLWSVAPAAESQLDSIDPKWGFLAALIAVAVAVVWFGNRQWNRQRGVDQLRPRGRERFGFAGRRDPQFAPAAARLEARDPVAIAEASSGLCRMVGEVVGASGNLGGTPGRECVWRNRAGGRPRSAVGAEVIFVADATGKIGVENIERAQVIAPTEQPTLHREVVSVYLGDRVEVIGHFSRDPVGQQSDPTQMVYGTVGARGTLRVRLVERPEPQPPTPPPEPESPRQGAEP